ncbi:MAG: preprotein translocase subunit YajC [Acidimicrobiia bacterium]
MFISLFATIGAATTTAKSSGGILSILPLVLIFGAMYFLLLRPQRKRQKETRNLQSALQEGDEVILASGIYGFISAIEDGYVWLDIAEKVEIRVARSAIATKVSTPSSSDQSPPDKNEKK